jgi:hypothetical protein
MLIVGHITLLGMVIKTNVMWPFSIEHHISICPNTSVASIKTNTRKKKIPPELPPLCMATKTKFSRHKIGDQKISITDLVVTKI